MQKVRTLFFCLCVSWAMLICTAACRQETHKDEVTFGECLDCHRGIERISKNHTDDCQSCHIRPELRTGGGVENHDEIIRNPSHPQYVRIFCLSCHENEIDAIETSLHTTMAGIINQTRFLWGAQKSASPATYGLGPALKELPEPNPDAYHDDPRLLVDDFLRRRCLRCHLSSRGPKGRGLYRSTGCAACHVIYNDDGLYGGKDDAIDRSKPGYPVTHKFTVDIPNEQCLHCHNQNNVGADYAGLFEHDYSSTYRSPMVAGRQNPTLYGMNHHHLSKDIHAEKGLKCIDCHDKKDVMGDGRLYSYAMEVPKVRCTDCHDGLEGQVDGNNVAHGIEAHQRVRCSACHAQWSYQDYGLSVIREDRSEGRKWYRLTRQADPFLEQVMEAQLEHPRGLPLTSKDWVTGDVRLGVWSIGWRLRRWEHLPLGIDPMGLYAVIRPRHQYLVSYVDRLGNVPLDSVAPFRGDGSGTGWAFMPYVPHTISPAGRRCEGCHLNPMAVGRGIFQEKTVDLSLMTPSKPPIGGMRLLTSEEQERLLNPSLQWKKARAKFLSQGIIP